GCAEAAAFPVAAFAEGTVVAGRAVVVGAALFAAATAGLARKSASIAALVGRAFSMAALWIGTAVVATVAVAIAVGELAGVVAVVAAVALARAAAAAFASGLVLEPGRVVVVFVVAWVVAVVRHGDAPASGGARRPALRRSAHRVH